MDHVPPLPYPKKGHALFGGPLRLISSGQAKPARFKVLPPAKHLHAAFARSGLRPAAHCLTYRCTPLPRIPPVLRNGPHTTPAIPQKGPCPFRGPLRLISNGQAKPARFKVLPPAKHLHAAFARSGLRPAAHCLTYRCTPLPRIPPVLRNGPHTTPAIRRRW